MREDRCRECRLGNVLHLISSPVLLQPATQSGYFIARCQVGGRGAALAVRVSNILLLAFLTFTFDIETF